MAHQNLNVCDFNKYGFCKFKSTCRKPHIMEICSKNDCEIRVCSLRHPKLCRYFREIGYCKFGEWCLFKHGNGVKMNIALENVDSKIVKLENESRKLREILTEKDAAIESLEEKLGVLEKKLEDVTSLLGEKIELLENKENKCEREKDLDTKLKDLEEKQSNLIEESNGKYKCNHCDFTTYFKRGLTIHKKKMHKVFPCTKCDNIFDTKADWKIHEYTHSYTSESNSNKCNNCDFECECTYTIEVHISKCRKEEFECGLCEEKFQDEISLEVHLRACEIYECCKCWKRVKNLSDIKRHILAKHSESVNFNHLKIDREKEFNVKVKTYDLKEV